MGLMPLPPIYFLWLAVFVLGYMALATLIKKSISIDTENGFKIEREALFLK